MIKDNKWKRVLAFVSAVQKEFLKDKCLIRASSLAYSSLLAIVPLSALIFALFTAFGAFNQVKNEVQNFIIKMLIPTMHQDFLEYLNSFVNNSKTLGIAGLLIFAVTSISLIDSVSENFNALWGSSNRRSFIAKFTSYSSVIVFGTLFIGSSFAISQPIHSVLMKHPEVLFLLRWIMQLFPSILIFITFVLMISAIPAGKVNIKSAAIGALTGTVLWDIARWFFVNGTNYILRMSVIYGSLAAIPIFLLWLYIIWIIVLSSLEITYVHQHRGHISRKSISGAKSPAIRMLTGLDIFFMVIENFIRGKKPYSASSLSYRLSISLEECIEYLKIFSRTGLLYVSNDYKSILPARDPESVKIAEVLESLFGNTDGTHQTPDFPEIIVGEFSTAGYASFKELKVKELLLERMENNAIEKNI